MSVNLENLLESIDKLEEAIYSAELKLSQGKKNSKYASRFDSYRRICDMQRRFSEEIFYLKAINNKDEIVRRVGLINGLSAMILDDIRNITTQNEQIRNKYSYQDTYNMN